MTNDDIKVIKDQCSSWKGFREAIIIQCKENEVPVDLELLKINNDFFPYQVYL